MPLDRSVCIAFDLQTCFSKSMQRFCPLVMQTVEASAANGRFIFKASYTSQEQSVPSIQGYAVLLPTILSVMYGQGEWPEESVSRLYGTLFPPCHSHSIILPHQYVSSFCCVSWQAPLFLHWHALSPHIELIPTLKLFLGITLPDVAQ